MIDTDFAIQLLIKQGIEEDRAREIIYQLAATESDLATRSRYHFPDTR